jgi:hypothetical protein
MNVITSGYNLPNDLPAGVKRLIFINFEEIDTMTIASGKCTALTLRTGKSAYAFNVEQEVTNYSEKSIGTKEAGSYGYEQSLSTKLKGNSDNMVTLMDTLSKARVTVIAQNNDGTYEMLFHQYGAKPTIERIVDAKYEGINGYNVTISHRQVEKSPIVDASVIASLTIA